MKFFKKIRKDHDSQKEGSEITANNDQEVKESEYQEDNQMIQGEKRETKPSFTAPTKVAFEKYTYLIILAVLFLLPVVFAPTLSIPFQFTKTFVIFVGILIALILFLSMSLREGKVTIPTNFVLLSVWLLPLAYFLSSIFSTNPRISFFGQNFEVDTFSFMFIMAVFVSLVVLSIRKREQALTTYLALFASFIVVWVFQGLRLIFGPEFLSFDVFNLATGNILGKWNDLSIFFGLATVMTLVTLAGLQLSYQYRRILYAMLLISLFFLAVVNFMLVWIVVGVFALGFFVHSLGITRFNWKSTPERVLEGDNVSDERPSENMKPASLVVLIVSMVFILGNSSYGSFVSDFFNISQIEARPSWQTTINIGKEVYKENLVFGSGPNTFVKTWTLHKPREVNETVFWNADFVSGIGSIPTAFITVGLLGVVAWLLFFVLFIYSGIRSLVISPATNKFSYYISLSSFLSALYLWAMAIFYTPNMVLIALAFFFTGVFIASLQYHDGRFREHEFDFANNQKIGFVAVLLLTLFLLASIVGLYAVAKEYVAMYQFQKGIISFNVNGDLDAAEQGALRALNISNRDRYHRLLADINIARLVALQSETGLSPDELRIRFQTFLANAIEYGVEATEVDPTNYQNWITLGRVYQSIVPLGIEGAYENAKTTYERAMSLYPKNPELELILARLELARNNIGLTREHIQKAIALKSNYSEAIFLLSQIEIREGNTDKAIESVESAAVLAPNNPVVFFQLGLLRYNERDNTEAIAAFERAVGLNQSYSNARYFLGLTYDRVGRTSDAISQFEVIEGLNPNNEEVKTILLNLRAFR